MAAKTGSQEPTTLSGITEKLRRASEHLESLQQISHEYLWEMPWACEIVTDRASCSYLVTVTQKPTPLRASTVFGDAIHNLRSCLDHLARQLVLANGGTPTDGPGGTMFPILDRLNKDHLVDIRPFGSISGEARSAVAAVQPYLSGADYATHPLWRLNRLDNIDKHRLLHLTTIRGGGQMAFYPDDGVEIVNTPDIARYAVALHSQATQQITVAPGDVYDRACMGGIWAMQLVLAEDGPDRNKSVEGITRQLIRYVTEDVLPRFVGCLHVNPE
jgi:hypothetical protein